MKIKYTFLLPFLFVFHFVQAQDSLQTITLKLKGLDSTISQSEDFDEVDYFTKDKKLIYEVWYDKEGKLTDINEGVAIMYHTYNALGKISELRYYNKEGNLFQFMGIGPAIERHIYNDKGQNTETHYLDTKGKLITFSFAKIKQKFDERNNVIEESYYNYKDEYADAIIRYKYDEKNRLTEQSYHKTSNGELVDTEEDEWAFKRIKYDNENRITEINYFDNKSFPVKNKSSIKYIYKKNSQMVTKTIYDQKGKKISENIINEDEVGEDD